MTGGPELPLLQVTRGPMLESRHRGRFVLLGTDGSVAASAGDVAAPLLPRSSLKPLQAAILVALGFTGRGPELALAAASHDGEPMHVAGVRRVLAAAGLDETALGCPAALPGGEAALLAWVAGGGTPAPVCHNCSGKHAAMLSTCAAQGWPTASYLEPGHPLQQQIAARLAVLTGSAVGGPVVDGCGAPAFAVPLRSLALAFRTLAVSVTGPEHEVAAAMRAHPQLIGGTRRAVSELAAAVPGLLAKEGAEGVWAAALPDGRAFAAKIEDGSPRALGPLLATVLQAWGVSSPVVDRWARPPTLGGGAPVGEITATAELSALLQTAC